MIPVFLYFFPLHAFTPHDPDENNFMPKIYEGVLIEAMLARCLTGQIYLRVSYTRVAGIQNST